MIFVCLACGLALALAFPRAGVAPLAWIAPVPWLVLTMRARPLRGFVLGYGFGLGFFGLLLAWVHGVLSHYTSLPLVLSLAIWVLLIAYLALYPALCGATLAALGARWGKAAVASAPFLWVGLEFARGRLLGGFPWGAIAYTGAGGHALMQSASVGGADLVSFLIATAWSSFVLLLDAAGRIPGSGGLSSRLRRAIGAPAVAGASSILIASTGLTVVVVALFMGAWRVRTHPAAPARDLFGALEGAGAEPGPRNRPFRIALVQGGYGSVLDYGEAEQALRDYIDLSLLAARFSPDVIVWPESNVPFQPDQSPTYLKTLEALARKAGSPLLLGAVSGGLETGLKNSAYLIGAEGVLARYDKRRLVQYGEYVPLKRFFPFIRHFVPEAGEFTPGETVGVIRVGESTMGVAICYELIFPSETLLQARSGADFLVNMTNDSWFPWGGPWQHADFAPMRAIETGLWTARAASTGRTLLVDPLGRVMAAGSLGGAALLTARLPVSKEKTGDTTMFVRWGEWVGKGCAAVTALVLAFLVVGNMIDRTRRVSLHPTA